jgi:hypothetical protein
VRLSRELLRKAIDVELTAGDEEVDPERGQHCDDEADLGEGEATTKGTRYERYSAVE